MIYFYLIVLVVASICFHHMSYFSIHIVTIICLSCLLLKVQLLLLELSSWFSIIMFIFVFIIYCLSSNILSAPCSFFHLSVSVLFVVGRLFFIYSSKFIGLGIILSTGKLFLIFLYLFCFITYLFEKFFSSSYLINFADYCFIKAY